MYIFEMYPETSFNFFQKKKKKTQKIHLKKYLMVRCVTIFSMKLVECEIM